MAGGNAIINEADARADTVGKQATSKDRNKEKPALPDAAELRLPHLGRGAPRHVFIGWRPSIAGTGQWLLPMTQQ